MLPSAPCAPVLCWWSSELDINSKHALLQGEGGWGLIRPCVHWPQHPILRQLGREPPGPISVTAQNWLLGAAFSKVKLSSGNQAQPQCLFAQESSAFWFLT